MSHLFFVDDLMLFGSATDYQAQVMLRCLNHFGDASELKVNLSKSQFFLLT